MLSNGFLDLTKFEKKKKIGKGSFGKVYIVEEKSTKQIYAAKVALKKISKNSPKDMLNISREVNIIAKLQHPSILQFIGYSQDDFDNKSPFHLQKMALVLICLHVQFFQLKNNCQIKKHDFLIFDHNL